MVVSNIPFEDNRISFPDWKEFRPTTPFLSLPLLEVDGVTMVQSLAMTRYLGRLGGLYPEDPLEAFKVDEVLESMGDLLLGMFSYKGKDKDLLREAREKFVNEHVPRYAGGIEKRLALHGGEGPWAVGGKLSVADLGIHTVFVNMRCGILDHVPTDVLDGYERMKAIHEAVEKIPEVVEWYKKHPVKYMK